MDAQDINYNRIDNGIKDLVYTLYQIPFINPIENLINPIEDFMCEGHLRDVASGEFIPDAGHKFIFSGSVGFFVDESYPNAKCFLDEVRRLKQKYHFFDLKQHHCGEGKDCSIEDTYNVRLDYSDLTPPETIHDRDNLETMTKKEHQVEISIGEQRIAEYQQAWSDFLVIARKYLEQP